MPQGRLEPRDGLDTAAVRRLPGRCADALADRLAILRPWCAFQRKGSGQDELPSPFHASETDRGLSSRRPPSECRALILG